MFTNSRQMLHIRGLPHVPCKSFSGILIFDLGTRPLILKQTTTKNQTCEDLEMFWSGGRRCDVYPLELTATAAVGAAGDVNTGIA